MRTAGLSGYVKRRKGTTTIRVPGVRVADDLVGRDFNPQAPNRLWTSDIKYVSTWEGTLYLASVIDCYSRRVVGWGCAPTCRPSSSSADGCARPGSPSRWARRATATTTPSARASTPPNRRQRRRSSTGSRPGTTASAATPASATAHPLTTNATTTKGVTARGTTTERTSLKKKQELPKVYVSTKAGAVHHCGPFNVASVAGTSP